MVDNIGSSSASNDDGYIKEQDRLLPIANVGRIMKRILPPNAKISKEGKETMQECVSEFISFVTSEASEKCRKERRKTVNGDDICCAMGNLGFDAYTAPLRRYLHRYRELEGDRANRERLSNSNTIVTDDKDQEEAPSHQYGSKPAATAANQQALDPTATPSKHFLIHDKSNSSTTSRPFIQ